MQVDQGIVHDLLNESLPTASWHDSTHSHANKLQLHMKMPHTTTTTTLNQHLHH